MAKPVYRRAFWGVAPSGEEVDHLGEILGCPVAAETRQRILSLFSDYSLARAAVREGIKPTVFRAHMRKLAKAARAAADVLDAPGYHSFEANGPSVLEKPQRRLPRGDIAHEAYLAIQHQLMRWDGDWVRKFGDGGHPRDLNLRRVEPVLTAWSLMRMAEVATKIADGLQNASPGRPGGGAAELVAGLIGALSDAGVSIKCRYDASSGDYVGNFREVAAWLSTLRQCVDEQEGVLCRYAVDVLSARRRRRKE